MLLFLSAPVYSSVSVCVCVCRAELQSLAEMIEASLSAAELKVKQKRQEELARMRCASIGLVHVTQLFFVCLLRALPHRPPPPL